MITYLTRMSFLDTAEDLALDQLAQQHKEAGELFSDLVFGEDEFVPKNHPVRRMWIGYEIALASYAACMALTLTQRGIVRGVESLVLSQPVTTLRRDHGLEFEMPPWFEDTDVMRSHRSNLVRRYPKTYGRAWKGTPLDLPYLWPVVEDEGYALLISKDDKAKLAAGERKLPEAMKKKVQNL